MSLERPGYCFDHTLLFQDSYDLLIHKQTCAQTLKAYTCNYYADNGQLCGFRSQSGLGLYRHALDVHHIHLCVDCEFMCSSIEELNSHVHIGDLGGRSRKCIFYF